MEQERRSIRIGLTAIALAAALRVLGSGVIQDAAVFLSKPEIMSFLLYLETGRAVQVAEATQAPAEETVSQHPTVSEQEVFSESKLPAVFTPADAQNIQLRNAAGYKVDLEKLMLQALEWNLKQDAPAVLLVHTHATESYTQTPENTYTPSSQYRTLDAGHNMLALGARLAQLLQQRGIQTVHDTTLHDYPAYTGSYSQSRKTIRSHLQDNPQIQMILDIHRDAVESESGKQLAQRITVSGKSVAQLMLVVGTDAGGLKHPDWEQNLALALKLHAQLERLCPGICRPISFRQERFNQDLTDGTLLIEVGAAGNTLPEAMAAVEILADAIAALAYGATAGSTS